MIRGRHDVNHRNTMASWHFVALTIEQNMPVWRYGLRYISTFRKNKKFDFGKLFMNNSLTVCQTVCER